MKARGTQVMIMLVIMFAVSSAVAGAGLQPLKVDPSRFIFEGRPGEQITGSIVVRNTGSDVATAQAVLSDWTLDEKNSLVLSDAGSLNSSLEGWIKFNPRRFRLAPQAAQTVRFTIKIPPGTAAGERRGMIAFEQTVPYSGGALGATTRVQVTSTMYVAVAPVQREIDIVGLHLEPAEQNGRSTLVLQVEGTGTGHYRGSGHFEILSADDETSLAAGELEPLIVMPGVSSRFSGQVEHVLAPGSYRLSVEIISEEAGSLPLHRIYSFDVPQSQV